jgi:23S rRNA (uracil-5-)-methyltransferase RumA
MSLTPKLFRRQIIDLTRNSDLIEPRCKHAPPNDFCGGCTFQDRSYEVQIQAKRAALQQLWADKLTPEQIEAIDMIGSPEPFSYRTRMDYVTSKERFGLRRGGKFNYIVDLQECHLIPDDAFAVARAVYQKAIELGLPDYNLRSHEGYLRYVVVRRSPSNHVLLAFVTASQEHASEMEQIAEFALSHPNVQGFHWLANETITDISFGTPVKHWGLDKLPMQVGKRVLDIEPNTFFQNNVHLLLPLLDDVLNVATRGYERDEQGRVAIRLGDLYGGVGTIALHLAEHVQQITCVESFAESASLGVHNIARNQVQNVEMVSADVLSYLREQPADSFDVLVLDPPRTGLGPDVCREILRIRPKRIVYVSCNVLTQIEDAHALSEAYRLTELRGYDMFPQTPHLEGLGVFERIENE